MEYVLWSAKLGGWMSRSATYTSELDDAKRFTKDEAFELCRTQHNKNNFGLLPVHTQDLADLT